MLDARVRPMTKWKEPTPLEFRNSQFRASYTKTLDALEYELDKLEAYDIFIEAGYSLQQLRNDGWPRGGQKPSHPGVVLYFKSKDGPLRFPCGTYNTFESNLHAIALTLGNLRAIDRYGVTLGHQQYLGFKALPPAQSEGWTVEDAANWLLTRGGYTVSERSVKDLLDISDVYRSVYKKVAMELHPDRGGNLEHFHVLQTVARLLDEHHGLKTNAGVAQ